MKFKKKVLGNLNKCYALATIMINQRQYVACAAEKEDACYLYDLDGNYIETLWNGPGGVMSLEEYTNQKYPTFLATWKFYSPNNGAESKIVYYQRVNGEWRIETLAVLPFVHRFGVIERNHEKYLVACTLKSAHAFKDDWTCPGRVWVAHLNKDITSYNEEHPLELKPLLSGLTKNHGFFKSDEDGYQFVTIGTDNGVFKIIPPSSKDEEWSYEKLIDDPVSDMLYLDFDGDGKRELFTFAPFHGDQLSIYKFINQNYEKIFEHPKRMPFLHAISHFEEDGKVIIVYGYRKEDMELKLCWYDATKNSYEEVTIDANSGPTNVLCIKDHGVIKIFAANRETNEIAMYTMEEEDARKVEKGSI